MNYLFNIYLEYILKNNKTNLDIKSWKDIIELLF
jgi:hypothetical protein